MSYQALLFCPDDKTARVVTQVLTELDFSVEPCNEPFAAVKKLMAQHFDAIVVDCDNEQNAALLFKSARNSGSNQSSLAVAVVEGQAGVAKAFRIGANLVLTKPINVEQSKGTLRVARGLLRKADSGKPAGSAVPEPKPQAPAPIASTPRMTAPSMQKPLAAFTAPPTPPAPMASDSVLELDEEPMPKPEPAEAALLESMPDVSTAVKPLPGTSAPKEYPWQPVSKLAEPMASALRVAAEAAAKPSELASKPSQWKTPLESSSDPFPSQGSAVTQTQSTGQAAAAAPAPIKIESPTPQRGSFATESTASDLFETKPEAAKASTISAEVSPIEPPTFGALAVKDHEEGVDEERGSKKAYVILVLVVLGILFTAYVGYQKMHSSSGQPPAPPAANAAPAPAASVPAGGSETSAPAATQSAMPQVPDITLSTPKASEPAKKPTPDVILSKPSAVVPSNSNVSKPAEVAEAAPEPILVKNGKAPAVSRTTEPEVEAPPAITAPADSKALSGIVAVTPTAVAKPVPTRLKVSQGVSQGLLMKRVQPEYPPQALQMRVQGTVELEANITKDGRIANVKVLKGDNILARAAVDAVKQWKYNPYFLNGEPVEIQTQISVVFKLPN